MTLTEEQKEKIEKVISACESYGNKGTAHYILEKLSDILEIDNFPEIEKLKVKK